MRRFTLGLCMVLLAPVMALGQTLADRLPSGAVVYVGWAGSEKMGPGYDGSHLKAMLDASDLSALLDKSLPSLMKKAGQENREAAEAMRMLAGIAPALWKHPSAFWFGGIDFSNPQQPMPKLAIVCQAGADAQKLLASVNDALAKAGPTPVPVKAVVMQDTVALVVGLVPELEPALVRGAAALPLAKDKKFAAAMAQVSGEPSVCAAYVDVESLLKLVDQGIRMAPGADQPNGPAASWAKARKALGLDGIQCAAMASGFADKNWTSQVFIAAPAPRSGLIGSLLDGQPLSDDTLKLVPASATMMVAGQLDLPKLVTGLRTAIEQVEPSAKPQIDQVMAQASEAIGMDVEKDLLACFGREWVLYASPEVGGNGFLGLVAVNPLADPAKAEAAMAKLEAKANELGGGFDPNVKIQIRQTTSGKTKIHYLAIPLVTPAWAIQDGKLYVALYPQMLGSALALKAGGSILDNPAFQSLRKQLGAQKVSSIQFTDLPRTAPESYAALVMISRLYMGFADVMGLETPPMAVPPLQQILPHLTPAGSQTWSDQAGWHARSLTPFPGAEMLGASSGLEAAPVASTALMASILLPSLNNARERANRVKCAANLRQIGMGCMIYANDNNGKYPPNLDALITAADLPRTALTCPSAQGGHGADYIYLGGSMKNNDPADAVLAYEKPENHSGNGGNVLFNDGHVEYFTAEGLKQVLPPQQPAQPRGGGL